MKLRLDYGDSGLEVELPDHNLKQVLRLKAAAAIEPESINSAIVRALEAPIECSPLSVQAAECAAKGGNACIVICDITRPVPNRLLLPPVLQTLEAAGINRDQITILIATGTHRPNLGDELVRLVGDEVASGYRIVNHECRNDDSHVNLGYSPAGVPVRLDRTYVEASLRVTIGLIEPHFMAGYSGGRKLIMPGIASFETVSNWHCPKFLESPFAQNGVVTGNPVHQEAHAIASMRPPGMILDVTLNEANQITGIFAGELESAWLKGVEFASQHVCVDVDVPADIVVTTCAGLPLDATFYQAVKGMVGALPAVKPRGTVIIAAECSEGIGSPDFARALLETDDLETFVRYISQPGVFVPEEWEVEELAKAVRHADVTCVTSGIDAATLSQCFVTPAESVEMAVESALAKHGADATIIAIPRGPYVIPTRTATPIQGAH